MKHTFLFFILFLATHFTHAQGTQTIRGTVIEAETSSPLGFVVVRIYRDSSLISGTTSDLNGNYRFEKLPVGRYSLVANFAGYQPTVMRDIILGSGKEVILNIRMESSVQQTNEVVIEGNKAGETNNEMTSVSARQFSVEETDRYAGSRGDPARMASNFAGVQGADDSRNDIVVRGNSPMGVLWRFEGVDIPNPNHFAIEGTTGGPVGILNNKVLANSDFFTGAFPAEFGNGIAGAFDLRMRNGNNEKFEVTGQFGFLGTEISAEGPLSKTRGSSFLINYRYSTLKLFEAMKIPIGTGAVPNYQDAAFRLNFPMKNGGTLAFFGVGGTSKIDIIVSKYTEPNDELYGEDSRDQYFRSGMGVTGVTYAKPVNENFYYRAVVAYSYRKSFSEHLLVYRDSTFAVDSITPKMGYKNAEGKLSANIYFVRKYGNRNTLKYGLFNDFYQNSLVDSIHSEVTYLFYNRQNYTGTSFLIQPYAQWKHKASDALVFNFGVHAQYFTLNGSRSIEPRAGLRWNFADRQTLSLGAGMHSQLLPSYIYYTHIPATTAPYSLQNKNLDFMRSIHSVVGYDVLATKNLRFKIEAYYQYLYNIPVDKKTSSFSALNQGTGFSRFFPDTLVNEGTGENYGIEFTAEKSFSNHYFVLITASLFDATYRGSDGIKRNTDFNTKYAVNMLGAREFKIGEKQTIQLGAKLTLAGKRWYTPIDTAASRLESDEVLIDSLRNTKQFSSSYFRLDIKVNWRLNTKKLTHEIGLDLVNVTGRKNILGLTYSPDPLNPQRDPVIEQYQLGFLPLFYYKVDF
ncbi:MAG: carboxypeptidase regulatory-like domain-containing protein [Bacteroidia bacterium]